MSDNVYELHTPALRWRITLNPASRLDLVVAHSFATYELVFTLGGEFSEAHMVDVKQGLIWSDNKQGSKYVAKGLRLENDRIVDTGGEAVVKLGFTPDRLLLGRRIVAAVGGKRVKMLDRVSFTEQLSAKISSAGFVSDEYTLALLLQLKRGKSLLVVDTIYGFSTLKLERSGVSLKARRGCVVACTRFACIATNGLVSEHIAASQIKPLASLRYSCIVAARSSTRWVVMLLQSGGTEAIGTCSSEPIPVYSDDEVLLYACDNRVYAVRGKSGIVEAVDGYEDNTVYTPSRRGALLEIDGVKTLTFSGEGWRVTIPVEEYYAVYRDSILVVSGGWLYSIDAGTHESNTVVVSSNTCPLRMLVTFHTLLPLKFEVNGDVETNNLRIKGREVLACLEPARLDSDHLEVKVRAYLAPPTIVEERLKLPPPKPRLHIEGFIVKESGSLHSVDGDWFDVERGSGLVVVRVPLEWLKLLTGAEVALMDSTRKILDLQPISDEVVLVASREQMTGSQLVVAVKLGNTLFEYPVDLHDHISPPEIPSVRLAASPVLKSGYIEAVVQADAMGVDALIIGSDVVRGRGVVKLPAGSVETRICACKKISSKTFICKCEKSSEIYRLLTREVAVVTDLEVDRVALVEKSRPRIKLSLKVEKPGVVYARLVAGEDEELASATLHVGKGLQQLSLELSRSPARPLFSTIELTHARGVVTRGTLLVPYRDDSLVAFRAGEHLIACADGIIVYESNGRYEYSECAVLDEEDKVVLVIDKCGYIHKPRLEILDAEDLLRRAASVAAILARRLSL